MTFVKPYGKREPHLHGFACEGESLTKQSFKDECDINNILRLQKNTGVVTHLNHAQGAFIDVTDAVDYQTAFAIVEDAREAFMSIPSEIRRRFDNDPAVFLEFMHNPANEQEIYDLKLAVRPEPDPQPNPPADSVPPVV